MIRTVFLDDEPWTLIYLSHLIDWEANGFEVDAVFQDSAQAFAHVKQYPPDLMIIDISMPGMSGLDFIRELRSAGIRPHIVILSGFAEFDYAQQAIRLGAVDYCLKPISQSRLLALLDEIKKLERPVHTIQTSDIHYKLKKITAYIDTHFGERLNIEMLAEKFEISPTYCSKLFTKELGTTFTAYLLKTRMRAAQRMLSQTALPIKDIVEQCGYSDYAHFHKVFSKYSGITAAQYRRRNQ